MEKEKELPLQEQQQINELFEIIYLTDCNAVFTHTQGGFLALRFAEKDYKKIALHRSFPFSEPDLYISVRDTDGNEIGMIKNINDLQVETKVLLEEQLNYRYFSPIISSIKDIKEEYGYAYWQVTTDRGECRFTVPMGSNIIRITESRLMITDIDGNRFEIPDTNKLSPSELKKLDLYI